MAPSSASKFFRRLFHDFEPAHDGFHRLLQVLQKGEDVHLATDGSMIENEESSAGWLFWMMIYDEDDDDSDEDTKHVEKRTPLLANTILVDGRLESNSSYRAEAMGKLTGSIILHCIYKFINRKPTKTTYHTCDNQALISRINNIRENSDFHASTDPIDGDIVIPAAHWADKIKLKSTWARGHPERRKEDPKDWTDDEWANDIADHYADRAWRTPSRPHCSPIAITFHHHHSLQIQVPSGSMSGKIARQLADDINTRRGLQQLQKVFHLDDDTFSTIDWKSFNTASTKYTKTTYSRAQFSKHIGGQWFTEARAHTYDHLASDKCRCCDDGKIESLEHILQCSSRKPIHQQYTTKFEEMMRDYEIPNDVLKMFEAGIDMALFPSARPLFDDDDSDMAELMEDERVTRFLNDEYIREDRREAFAQQTKLGWTRLFMGFMSMEWRRSTDKLDQRWTRSCIRLFLDWGRACWTHRNTVLFGPSKKRYQLRRQRLQEEARVWLNAPRTESLVPIHNNRSMQKDITRATTETIATWIQRQTVLRRKIRNNKQTSIISTFTSEEKLLEADRNFHRKIIAARRGIRANTTNTLTNEEPPD